MEAGVLNDQNCRLRGKQLPIVCSAVSGTLDVLTELQVSWQTRFLYFIIIFSFFCFHFFFFTAPACQGNLLHQPLQEFQVCPVTETDTEEVRWMDKVKAETQRARAAVPKPGIKHALFAPETFYSVDWPPAALTCSPGNPAGP